jgi:hypothetical protein
MAMRIDADVEILAGAPAWGPCREPVPGEVATVRVTAGDIRAGERCDCLKCPIALALSRVWPDAVVAVTSDTVYLYASREDWDDCNTEPVEVWLHDAEDFVDLYDDRRAVEPRDIRVQLLQRLN